MKKERMLLLGFIFTSVICAFGWLSSFNQLEFYMAGVTFLALERNFMFFTVWHIAFVGLIVGLWYNILYKEGE